jgi:hypothetical protein
MELSSDEFSVEIAAKDGNAQIFSTEFSVTNCAIE